MAARRRSRFYMRSMHGSTHQNDHKQSWCGPAGEMRDVHSIFPWVYLDLIND